MRINFSLSLPRDSATVPVVRGICRDALDVLGVENGCTDAIQLAVSEACTNVLKHVEGTPDEYEVDVSLDEDVCAIKVIDTGMGFDHNDFGSEDDRDGLNTSAEGGRGIFLMRAMVDQIKFTSEPKSGTVVHLVKKLEFEPDSVLRDIGTMAKA
jgi:serine/threonine-protein kinase RsbW